MISLFSRQGLMCIQYPAWNMVVLPADVWFSFQARNTVAFPDSLWRDAAR